MQKKKEIFYCDITFIFTERHSSLIAFANPNSMLRQIEFRLSGKSDRNIYNCGYCGRKMQKDGNGGLRCNQRYLIKECKCQSAVINLEEANEAVLSALKQQIRLFVKETELSKAAKNKTIPYSEGAEIATLIKNHCYNEKDMDATL